MNKGIQVLMKLGLLVGSTLLSAPTVWAHECDPSPVRLQVGQRGTYTIHADGLTTNYKVTMNSNPSVARITPEVLNGVKDGVFTVEALSVGVTHIKIHWEIGDFDEDGKPDEEGDCPPEPGGTIEVEVVRATDEFPPVEEQCGFQDLIYKNNSANGVSVTVRATTTCNIQSFQVRDSSGNPDATERLSRLDGTRTFPFTVPASGSVTMTCSGTETDTCSYRIQGFATTPDKQEGCGFGPAPIYTNSSAKNVDVTIQATTTCDRQSFQVKDRSGNRVAGDSLTFMERTRTLTFTVPAGGSIEMNCAGEDGECSYSFAVASGAVRDDEVACGRGQQIFTNRSRNSVDVTVQVTAFCEDGATIVLTGSSELEDISEGQTRTRTFTVPPRGAIALTCKSDRGGGKGCPYTVIEGK